MRFVYVLAHPSHNWVYRMCILAHVKIECCIYCLKHACYYETVEFA